MQKWLKTVKKLVLWLGPFTKTTGEGQVVRVGGDLRGRVSLENVGMCEPLAPLTSGPGRLGCAAWVWACSGLGSDFCLRRGRVRPATRRLSLLPPRTELGAPFLMKSEWTSGWELTNWLKGKCLPHPLPTFTVTGKAVGENASPFKASAAGDSHGGAGSESHL